LTILKRIDLEQVLAKEPNNQVAKQELLKVEEHLKAAKKVSLIRYEPASEQ
jgi:hypothetical protein